MDVPDADENQCAGEIMYAECYGSLARRVYHSSVRVTRAWLDVVRERGRVACDDVAWADFDLDTDAALSDGDGDDGPETVAMRRFCYRRFCESLVGLTGDTGLSVYVHRVFRPNRQMDVHDSRYSLFVDSMLSGARFAVGVRLPSKRPPSVVSGAAAVQPVNAMSESTVDALLSQLDEEYKTREMVESRSPPPEKMDCDDDDENRSLAEKMYYEAGGEDVDGFYYFDDYREYCSKENVNPRDNVKKTSCRDVVTTGGVSPPGERRRNTVDPYSPAMLYSPIVDTAETDKYGK